MTEEIPAAPAYDVGHLLPDDAWARVQAEVEAWRPRLLAPLAATRSAFPSVTGFVQCRWDGGPQPGPITFGVLHDAETPLQAGYAQAIANYFASDPIQTSAHFMVDPAATIQMLDTSRIAWHCGDGNQRSIGVEQAGYVRFTAADWTTADGMAQMARVANLMRDIRSVHGVGLFWMTDQQLVDAHAGRIVGGWATHDQCRRVLGGTSHTDPMPTYPLQQLMALANDGPTEDDMTDEQWLYIQKGIDVTNSALGQLLNAINDPKIGILNNANTAAGAAQQAVKLLQAGVTATIDLAAIKQAVVDGVKAAAGPGVDTDAIVTGVLAGIAARMNTTPAA